MKPKFLILFVALFCLTAFSTPLADITIDCGETVTSSGTDVIEVEFTHMIKTDWTNIYIHVDADNSGTIQFAVGKSDMTGQEAVVAGAKIPLKVRNGKYNLYYKASGASQSFFVTY